MVEFEANIVLLKIFLAPVDAFLIHVITTISTFWSKIVHQWNRHSPNSAADVKNAVAFLKTGKFYKIVEKLQPYGHVVTVTHKDIVLGRQQNIALPYLSFDIFDNARRQRRVSHVFTHTQNLVVV